MTLLESLNPPQPPLPQLLCRPKRTCIARADGPPRTSITRHGEPLGAAISGADFSILQSFRLKPGFDFSINGLGFFFCRTEETGVYISTFFRWLLEHFIADNNN